MFFEYWQIGALLAVYAYSLTQVYKNGVILGTETTIDYLEENKIIRVDGDDIYAIGEE